MPITRTVVVAFAVVVLAQAPRAQGSPTPAPEMKRLQPMIGNWEGAGTANMAPGQPPTKWEARGTYRPSHDGHFVREDFMVTFEGMPEPMRMRGYLGWDRENQRYVSIVASNSGEVRLCTLTMMPDGSMVQLMLQAQNGMPFAERSVLAITGDEMKHSLDLMMPMGPTLTVLDSAFKRGGKGCDDALDGKMFAGRKAHADLVRLCKSVGTYQVEGSMVMMPGAPETKIHGTDTAHSFWQDSMLHIATVGTAEGMPGEYRGDVMWGHDELRNCIVGVYVSNFGEVMTMDAHWTADGKLLATTAAKFMGEPSLQRTVMEFDANGASTKAWSHSLIGTNPPLQSFSATYTKK